MAAYRFSPAYPTPQHAEAARVLVEHYRDQPEIVAVLLVNSCARGKATPDSCLDIVLLAPAGVEAPELERLTNRWEDFYQAHPAFSALREVGRYSVAHVDVISGDYTPGVWDDGGGPDGFELEVGNHLAYSVTLHERGDYLRELRQQWLPYYGEELRAQRLRMVQDACRYDLDHVETFVERGLYFQAFDRLYKGFQEFLQALFIARRTYPIAYNKWIHEQVVDILGLPELYPHLPRLFEIRQFEGRELVHKADQVLNLLEKYTSS